MQDATPFRYYLRVRYGECDAQKVVFNAHYGEYVDLAFSEFMRALGYGAEMASGELDFQLVRQTTEWKAPVRFDDVVEISVKALRLGTTSLSVGYEFRIAGKQAITATSETIYVLVNAHDLKKRELPPQFRAQLASGAVGQQTDHAHYLPR